MEYITYFYQSIRAINTCMFICKIQISLCCCWHSIIVVYILNFIFLLGKIQKLLPSAFKKTTNEIIAHMYDFSKYIACRRIYSKFSTVKYVKNYAHICMRVNVMHANIKTSLSRQHYLFIYISIFKDIGNYEIYLNFGLL